MIRTVVLNGELAALIEVDDDRSTVCFVVRENRVSRIYLMRNPEKLARISHAVVFTR